MASSLYYAKMVRLLKVALIYISYIKLIKSINQHNKGAIIDMVVYIKKQRMGSKAHHQYK